MRFLPILIFLSSLSVAALSAAERPNVLLILSDDQGWEDYGFMGHEIVETPHLDQLAEQSLVFEKGYVVSPLCRPSIASILTGVHPHVHGITGNDVTGSARKAARERQDKPLREAFFQHENLVSILAAEGYQSFQTGKWWEGSWEEGGFSDGMTHGDPVKGGRHGDRGLGIGRNGLEPVASFLDSASADKPFFLWYAPFLPHTPHNPPQELLEKYSQPGVSPGTAAYYAMCEWFDETCGQLLEMLDERGLRDNTLIVYACDNGWAAADASRMPLPEDWDQKYAPKSKGSPYELGIRTPFLFSLPGAIEPGRSRELASSLDLLPTILDLLQIQQPESLPGINLLKENREEVCGASYAIQGIDLSEPFDTLQYTWVRSGDWKYLRRHDGRDETRFKKVHTWDTAQQQLFHVGEDPWEENDLSKQNPGVVARLTEILDQEFPIPTANP